VKGLEQIEWQNSRQSNENTQDIQWQNSRQSNKILEKIYYGDFTTSQWHNSRHSVTEFYGDFKKYYGDFTTSHGHNSRHSVTECTTVEWKDLRHTSARIHVDQVKTLKIFSDRIQWQDPRQFNGNTQDIQWQNSRQSNERTRDIHIDRKNPPPPGGFPIYYVPWSRTRRKRTLLEESVPGASRGVLFLRVLDQGT